MKRFFGIALFALALSPLVGCAARGYHRYGPPPPPPPPREAMMGRHHHQDRVWVPGHYRWNGHRYRWVPGRWVKGSPWR